MSHTAPDTAKRLSLSAGLASVAVALTLVLLKLWAGLQTGSLSVAASLVDSALDLVMSLSATVAIIYAARPPDEDHAFGHTSAEDLTALAQSSFILLSGALVIWHAVSRLLAPEAVPLSSEGLGMSVMAVAIALTLALVWWQGRVARLTGNKVVAADRLHYLTDLVPNIGAILALWLSSQFGWGRVDAVIALIAGAIMITSAARIFKSAWDALMDKRADPQLIAQIAQIASHWPGVKGYHDLKTRTSGSRVFIHLHIELDGAQSLREAHAIGAALRRAIMQAHPQCDVIIHKDVAEDLPH